MVELIKIQQSWRLLHTGWLLEGEGQAEEGKEHSNPLHIHMNDNSFFTKKFEGKVICITYLIHEVQFKTVKSVVQGEVGGRLE